jgi:GNAT superfamily N-acetyltransferase
VPAAAGSPTEPLDARHLLDEFDCGEPPLNTWLKKYALANQRSDSSKTRVIADEHRKVLGYYSLATGSVGHDEAPLRVAHGLARHPIPVVVLTRLAVEVNAQGRGLGRVLLRDALRMVADVSDTVAVRALLVHAKNDRAREWYIRQAEFESLPGVPNRLFLLIKDLRAATGKD